MTKSMELHRAYEAFWQEHYTKVEAAAKEDFPIGRRVSWTRTYKGPKLYGKVTRYGYGGTVFVKNERSGRETRHDAHVLEPA